jgi:hypothetical protein
MRADNVFPFERRIPPTPPNDFSIPEALGKCRVLMQTLAQYELADDVYEACVATLLINLHDLLQKARGAGHPLTFSEHIDADDEVTNVTELVAKCRNAACHVWHRSNNTSSKLFSFGRVAGYCPRATVIDGIRRGCDFHDDAAIYYGKYRLYLKRHVSRAIDALSVMFS